jgi:hypothetical protein
MTLPLVGWFALCVLQAAPEASASDAHFEAVTLTGRVVELGAVLKELGLVSDSEPVAKQVVLRGDDGSIVPLLSDEGSRALFLDARLRNRPISIQGRRYAGLPYLQVVTFKVNDHGQWRTPEYFCEVCTISVRYPQICPCCQGAMELRMKPGAE